MMCVYMQICRYDTLTSRLSNKSIQKEKKEATSINSLTRLQDIYMGMCNFADLSMYTYINIYIYIHIEQHLIIF